MNFVNKIKNFNVCKNVEEKLPVPKKKIFSEKLAFGPLVWNSLGA